MKNGYGRFVAQIGGKDTDVPQLRDLVKDPAALSLIALVQSQGDIARLTAGPPGIPQPVLDALREAYRKALEDKELQEKAAKLERPVEPGYGDDVLNAIVTALKQPPETVALLAAGTEEKIAAARTASGRRRRCRPIDALSRRDSAAPDRLLQRHAARALVRVVPFPSSRCHKTVT